LQRKTHLGAVYSVKAWRGAFSIGKDPVQMQGDAGVVKRLAASEPDKPLR
jgi:hypothetical protein